MVANIRIVQKGALPRKTPRQPRTGSLTEILVEMGALDPARVPAVLASAARYEARLADILCVQGLVDEATVLAAQATLFRTRVIDTRRSRPDPRLIDRLGADRCLRDGLVPWSEAGGAVMIACARPELFERHRKDLAALFGHVAMCVASEAGLTEAVLAVRARTLARLAETRVPAAESCRDWRRGRAASVLGVVAAVLAAAFCAAPVQVMGILIAWAALTMAGLVALKGLAALAVLHARAGAPPVSEAGQQLTQIARLPCVSVMVPLFRENDIAPRLIQRLGRIDYPRELLDILLIVEEEDRRTLEALRRHGLPGWMRTAVVPAGSLKTKPRALNFGLDLCRGSIVGVWDAEDMPDPQQIRAVVRRFHERGSEVACLQGQLDYFNPRTNWIARCFTIEYAAWFRVLLPGLERLGLAIPLGGTSLFFRRAALESLGAWDAHNVTEDADLGMRLARHGYRTEIVETVTGEEANCRVLPWIRQRSRWLKGFMITWAVQMRAPRKTLAGLGWWKFLGMQVMLLGTLTQFALAPVLWCLWPVAFGLSQPPVAFAPWASALLMAVFLISEFVNMAVSAYACSGPRHRFLIAWVPTMLFYFPMATIAAYKALWELIVHPFYWDKTTHGLFDFIDQTPVPACPPGTGAAADRGAAGINAPAAATPPRRV